MGHEWIIDVIIDLQQYARAHGLLLLEAQLENTKTIAKVDEHRVIESQFLLNQGENPGTPKLPEVTGTSGSA
jgi:hypothetical protein